MSVEYRRYTIPKPNSFQPDISQLACFLEEASRQWSFYPGWIAHRGEGMKLSRDGTMVASAIGALREHSASGIRARFPFRWPGREYGYGLELHASAGEYVYHISETVAPFESTSCVKCGCRLDYQPAGNIFQERRIQPMCPRCGTSFDPSRLSTTYTHWLTGAKSALPGGATYRLALIIDNVPEEEWESFEVDPSFMELCKQAFRCEVYEVVDVV